MDGEYLGDAPSVCLFFAQGQQKLALSPSERAPSNRSSSLTPTFHPSSTSFSPPSAPHASPSPSTGSTHCPDTPLPRPPTPAASHHARTPTRSSCGVEELFSGNGKDDGPVAGRGERRCCVGFAGVKGVVVVIVSVSGSVGAIARARRCCELLLLLIRLLLLLLLAACCAARAHIPLRPNAQFGELGLRCRPSTGARRDVDVYR